MRLLLDTHVLLWWWLDAPRLSELARGLIENADNVVHVSAASAWEVAAKHRFGKLAVPLGLLEDFEAVTAAERFEALPIKTSHALQAGRYATAHRDPFDRILAAQAELEDFALVTADPAFTGFPCRTRW